MLHYDATNRLLQRYLQSVQDDTHRDRDTTQRNAARQERVTTAALDQNETQVATW